MRKPEAVKSFHHEGLSLFIARILRGLWNEPIFEISGASVRVKIRRESLFTIQSHLNSLLHFIYNEAFYKNAINYNFVGKPMRDSSSGTFPRQYIVDPLAEENESISSMIRIVIRCSEVVGLMNELLSINEDYEPRQFINENSFKYDAITNITLRNLTVSKDGERIVRLLATDYAKIILLEGSINYSQSRVSSICPDFLSVGDWELQVALREARTGNYENAINRIHMCGKHWCDTGVIDSNQLNFAAIELAKYGLAKNMLELCLYCAKHVGVKDVNENSTNEVSADKLSPRDLCYDAAIKMLSSLESPLEQERLTIWALKSNLGNSFQIPFYVWLLEPKATPSETERHRELLVRFWFF